MLSRSISAFRNALCSLQLCAVLFGGLLAISCAEAPQPTADQAPEVTTPERPHVLLLTIDTLRSDHLSSHGYPLPTTPYLDTLLSGGVVFPRALAPVPRTTPSLASLLTGAYPQTTGVRTLVDPLGDDMVSLTEVMAQQGYRTVAVVSNHILTPPRRLDRGFEIYHFGHDGRDTRDARGTVDTVFEVTKGFGRQERLFLWVHFIDPHVPYLPPSELLDDFVAPAYQGPYRDGFGQRRGGVGDLAYPVDLPKIEAVFRNPLSPEVNDHIRRLYAADIRHTDDQIARLVEGLRTRFRNDWTVVFTADHGEALGEHDVYYDHGDYVYNPSVVVPLAFVLPPGDPLGRHAMVDEWVSLVDVVPTLQELLGLPDAGLEAQRDGRSLMPVLRGEKLESAPVFAESGRSFFPSEVPRRRSFDIAGRFRTVIFDDWKLIWTPGHEEAFELYDLANDPGEMQDVYREDHPQAMVLRKHLRQWMRQAEDRPQDLSREGIDAEDWERLQSLGYLP